MHLVEDDIDFEQYLKERDSNEKVLSAATYSRQVYDRLYGNHNVDAPHMPWDKTRDLFQMRPCEVTLWAGVNGHGKSLVTSQIALGLLQQGHKVCIASFEMTPDSTLARMVKQAAGSATPSEKNINEFLDWTEGKLWIYDQLGTVDPDRLRAVIRHCYEKHGIEHFFIDSLMKVVKGDDDYNGQKNFVDEVTALARETQMHIHLVAHVRKGQTEYDVPDKFSVKGSSSVTDQVDNVWIVFRNKKKEDQMRNVMNSPEKMEELRGIPDSLLICAKQRHGNWEGKVGLWIHPDSMAYVERPKERPRWFEITKQPVKRDPHLYIRADEFAEELPDEQVHG